MVSASRCVWASRRPGKVRKAPSMDPTKASPRRMASLARGSLGRREGSGGPKACQQPPYKSQPALAPPHFPGLTPSPSPASSEVAPSSGSYWRGLGKTTRGQCLTDPWSLSVCSAPLPDRLLLPRYEYISGSQAQCQAKGKLSLYFGYVHFLFWFGLGFGFLFFF